MAGEALRKVFAEFGIKWKADDLDKGKKKVDATAKSVRGFAQDGAIDTLKSKLASISPTVAKLADNFDKLSPAAQRSAKQIIASAAILGTAAIALRKAFEFADEFAAKAEELRDASRDLRMTTTELQEFRYAALQSGVGVDRMGSALRKFRTDLNAAERWGNGTTWMLRRLGVQVRDGTGRIRPMADLMGDLAVAFDRVPNPLRRTRLAVRLFGEDGRRMLDVLHGGPGGLAALRDEMDALGGVSEEAAQASREYTMAQTRLTTAGDGLRSVLAVSVLPALTWMVTKAKDLTVGFIKLTRGTYLVKVAMGLLAVAGVAAGLKLIAVWGPAILPFVIMAAKIAAVVLIIEDLVTWINGGDSAIGRLIDRIFGLGTSATVVRELKEDWRIIADWITKAAEALARFTGAAESPAVARLGQPLINGRRVTPGARRTPQEMSPEAQRILANAGVASGPGPRVVAPVSSLVQPVTQTVQRAGDNNVFHITNPSPTAVAREVERRMDERARRERDAAMPTAAEE